MNLGLDYDNTLLTLAVQSRAYKDITALVPYSSLVAIFAVSSAKIMTSHTKETEKISRRNNWVSGML